MQWKVVVNYEGLYEVSNTGLIKSLNYKRTGKEKILLPSKDAKGYFRTSLMKNGKLSTIKIHREIAKSFIPNPENKPQVNHINGVKTDNRVENLEWCTNQENIKHAYKNNMITILSGDSHHKVKISDKIVLEIFERNKKGESKRSLVKEFNCDRSIFKRKIINK